MRHNRILIVSLVCQSHQFCGKLCARLAIELAFTIRLWRMRTASTRFSDQIGVIIVSDTPTPSVVALIAYDKV